MTEKELILKIKSIFDGTGFDQVKSKAGEFQDKMGSVSKGVAAGLIAGGLAVTAFGASSVAAAATFEAGMSNIQAVSGATADEMQTVHDKAMQIGADTAFSAQEAAMGMEELLKAGVNVKDMMTGAADATISLASAGGTDLPTAAAIASAAMNNFGMSGAELPRVADLIAGAANASAISVEDFGYSLSASGAVANLAGVSFDDLSVAITAMGNAGIKGSDAGTSLKTFMSNMIPTTNTQIDAFKSLGIITTEATGQMVNGLRSASDISKQVSMDIAGMSKAEKEAYLVTQFGNVAYDETGKKLRSVSELAKVAVRDHMAIATTQTEGTRQVNLFVDQQTGSFKSLAEVAGILKDKLGPLSETQRMVALEAMFGSDAIRAAAVIAENGAEGFTKLAAEMTKVSAADVAATRLDNLKGSVDAFWGSVETLQIKVGEKLLPTIRKIVDAGSGIVNALGSLFGSATVDAEAMATGVSGSVDKTLLASQGMSKAFAGLGIDIDPAVFSDLITAVQDGISKVKEAFAGVEGGDMAGSIVKAIVGITDAIVFLIENPAVAKAGAIVIGLVAAFAPIMMIVGPLIPLFGGLAGVITGTLGLALGPLILAIGVLVGAMLLWRAKGDEIIAWLTTFGNSINEAWTSFQATVVTAMVNIGTSISDGWAEFQVTIVTALVGIGTTINEKWAEFQAYIALKLVEIGTSIATNWTAFWTTITTKLGEIWTAVTTKWEEVKTAIADALESIAENLRLKWDAFLRQISEKLDAILAKTSEAWTNVKQAIDDAMVAVESGLTAAWDRVKGLIDSAWSAIENVIQTALDIIQGTIYGWLTWIEDKTGASLGAVKSIFDSAMFAIKDAVSAVVAFIKGDWGAALEYAKSAAQNAWDAITGAFTAGWEAIKSILRIDDIIALFTTLKDKLKDVGGQIVDGIREGIAGSWEALKRFLSDQIGDLIAFAKRLLGIASPSKRTRDELGIPMGEGVIGGAVDALLAGRGRVGEALGNLIKADPLIPAAITAGAILAAGITSGLTAGIAKADWGSLIGRGLGSGNLGAIGAGMGFGAGSRIGNGGAGSGFGGYGGPAGRGTGQGNSFGRMTMPSGGPSTGVGDVVARWNTSGRGGHVAASKSNYWQVFVQRFGVPTEASARKVAERLGIPLPAWLEQMYKPMEGVAGATAGLDLAASGRAGVAAAQAVVDLTQFNTATAAATSAIGALTTNIGNLGGAVGAVAGLLEPGSGGPGGIALPGNPIGRDHPIVIEPGAIGDATIESVTLGDIVMGDTHVYIDGEEIARATARTIIENVTLLDDLGKALGQRQAQRNA